MTKRMLIDATHAEETRVVVLDGTRLEDFDVETSTKRQLKGNIYLAKVVRVEPSLQAAFVEYGGNRHGFLAFSEIHPDYYQIPVADRQRLIEMQAEEARREEEEDDLELALSHGAAPEVQDTAPVPVVAEASSAAQTAAPMEARSEMASTAEAWSLPSTPRLLAPEPAPPRPVSTEPVAPAVESASHAPSEPVVPASEAWAKAETPPLLRAPSTQALAIRSDRVDGGRADGGRADGGRINGGHSTDEGAEEDEPEDDESGPFDANGDQIEVLPPPETVGGGDQESIDDQRERRLPPRFLRNYKIQEVIRRRQILLVQVVKEERGTKGAALTTYLSLAGRFGVLMPNSPRGGGISRKITSPADRRRLKEVMAELDIPRGMGMIVRTAGANRPKPEIKRDCEYLLRLWDDIREHTMKSVAPALIYEEASLIKRAIRDVYSRDIDEILVDGEEGWRAAHSFMRMLMPSHAKKVQLWRDPSQPLFARHQVEAQLDGMLLPTVQLRSGGYLVINQAEALVAIDVNSGRSTRERNIEETALRTNLEAADEVARQLRLRDLAGLIVIDFIDMESKRHNAMVERRIKEALKNDRARIQVGHISHFGLLEMSRQRLRPSLAETSFILCPHCGGTGHVRSTENAAIHVLRGIEEEGGKRRSAEIVVHVSTPVALYLLNHKRERLQEIELRYAMRVIIGADDAQIAPQFRIEKIRSRSPDEIAPVITAERPVVPPASIEDDDEDEEAEAVEIEDEDEDVDEDTAEQPATDAAGSAADDAERRRKRRRRRRRGRRDEPLGAASGDGADESGEEADEQADTALAAAVAPKVIPGEAPAIGPVEAGSPVEAGFREAEPEARPRAAEPEPGRPDAAPAETGPADAAVVDIGAADAAVEAPAESADGAATEEDQRNRRRGRRGGRRRRRDEGELSPVAVPGADQPELLPVYAGPTPADPFGGSAFDIFDVMDQVERAAETRPAPRTTPVEANSGTAVPRTAPKRQEPALSQPQAPEPLTSDPLASESATSEPVTSEPVTSESVTSGALTREPLASEPVTSEPLSSEPVAVASEPAPAEERPTSAEAGSAGPASEQPATEGGASGPAQTVGVAGSADEPMHAATDQAAASPPAPANDTIAEIIQPEPPPPEPLVKPILIGTGAEPPAEPKRGWWRRQARAE